MNMIEYIGSIGGIVGIFGYLIFLAYRDTIKQIRDDRKFMEDRLSKIIESYNTTTSENTKVLFELKTWLQAKNGNKN